MRRPSVRVERATPEDYRAVLIYDGECPFCSAAASALRRLRDVGAVAWRDEHAQDVLRAQFDEVPFALVLVDAAEERVYVGREAAREVCERAGLPALIADVVGDNYESIADAVRSATGAAAEPDVYHDTVPLSDAAAETFDRLARAAGGHAVIATD